MTNPPKGRAPTSDPKITKVPAQTCYCPAYKHPHRWGGGKCTCKAAVQKPSKPE